MREVDFKSVCILSQGCACVAQWQSICLVNRRSPVQSRAEACLFHAASVPVCASRPQTRERLLLLLLSVNNRESTTFGRITQLEYLFLADGGGWRVAHTCDRYIIGLGACKPRISSKTYDSRCPDHSPEQHTMRAGEHQMGTNARYSARRSIVQYTRRKRSRPVGRGS